MIITPFIYNNISQFIDTALAKQSRQGKIIQEFFFPSFPDNTMLLYYILCPVSTLHGVQGQNFAIVFRGV